MAGFADVVRRRRFEFELLRDMACATFQARAFASVDDLEAGRRQIVSADRADRATKYRFTLRIPTLIGPGRFAPQTEIGVDTEVPDYPRTEPATWIISKPVPWSPHFRENAPVCLGEEFWLASRGHVTLGHLAIHIARMLNWDEKSRGRGYVGWNGPAIEYHRRHYGSRPLDPDLAYPKLPDWLNPAPVDPPGFTILGGSGPPGRIDFEWRR